MIKQLATSAALLMAMACTSMNSATETGSNGGSVVPKGVAASEFILLSSPAAARAIDITMPPQGLHVRGKMTTAGFQPAGEIQGRGKFCADGKDWLSLSDLRLRKAGDGTPVAPYILGCVSGSTFSPASREVVTQ